VRGDAARAAADLEDARVAGRQARLDQLALVGANAALTRIVAAIELQVERHQLVEVLLVDAVQHQVVAGARRLSVREPREGVRAGGTDQDAGQVALVAPRHQGPQLVAGNLPIGAQLAAYRRHGATIPCQLPPWSTSG
jgi:hypothetical protein